MTERLQCIAVQSVEHAAQRLIVCVALFCACSQIFFFAWLRIIIELIYIYYYCQFEQQIRPIVSNQSNERQPEKWARDGEQERERGVVEKFAINPN